MSSVLAGAVEEWNKQIHAIREQGNSVTSCVSGAVARAVLESKAPSLLLRHGGNVKMSSRTGQRILEHEGKPWRKRTSSRMLPPIAEVIEAKDQFYGELRNIPVVIPELDINFDQTFHLFNPTRGFA